MNRLSIITINYNNRDGLKKTIESVVGQTLVDFEYVIIDGGSSDGSVDAIQEYADKIDYWVSEHDKGIYNAMNKGVKAAHGDYLLFLNSGDYLCDNKVIETLYSCQLDTDFVCGNIITDNGGGLKSPNKVTMNFFLNGTLPHPSSFIKRSLFEIHPYDERYKISGDWEFFLYHLIVKNASYKHIELDVAVYDTNGISSITKKEERDKDLKKTCINNLLFPRVKEDYDHFTGADDNYYRLFYTISNSKYKETIYKIVVVFIKIITLNRGWIKSFNLRCKSL